MNTSEKTHSRNPFKSTSKSDLDLVMKAPNNTRTDVKGALENSGLSGKKLRISGLSKKYGFNPLYLDKSKKIIWRKPIEVLISINLEAGGSSWKSVILTDILETTTEVADTTVNWVESNVGTKIEEASYRVQLAATTLCSELYKIYEAHFDSRQKLLFLNAIKSISTKSLKESDISFKYFKELMPANLKQIIARVDSDSTQEELGLNDYPESFPIARFMKRHFKFRLGPTNSGKTYEALEALKGAKSGLYLAPLRLLAMEAYDALTQAGVVCNLITGEEKIIHPNATHIAATVEMMNPENAVEIAVIDEIQMIMDTQRGWAWTAALIGVPAKIVYMCGADNALKPCIEALNLLGDTHEIKRLDRKVEFTVQSKPLIKSYKKFKFVALEKGDAVIAFSRKDVLNLTAEIRQAGFTVSCIYGALSPEVRRTQAELFASGSADIIVATDAIGMGLNLPIKRVIFSTLEKFDGTAVTKLDPVHIKQIAGRAGRFGKYNEGFATALNKEDIDLLRKGWTSPNKAYTGKLPIAPNMNHIHKLAKLLGTSNIAEILSYFTLKISLNNSIFGIASLSDTLNTAFWVEKMAPELSLEDKFNFSCAPTSTKEEDFEFFMKCLKAYYNYGTLKAPTLTSRGLSTFNPKLLWQAEQLSKDLGLYSWLSLKFPATFPDYEYLAEHRGQVSEFIKRALLVQK